MQDILASLHPSIQAWFSRPQQPDYRSRLFDPSKKDDTYNTDMTQILSTEECGIGMEMEKDKRGNWVVIATRPGGPADSSGNINPGDRIVAVDWIPVQGKGEWEVQRMLYGPQGSSVTVEVEWTDGSSRHVTIVRHAGDLVLMGEEGCADKDYSEMTCCTKLLNRCPPAANCLRPQKQTTF